MNTALQPEQVPPHHRFSTIWIAMPIPGFAVYPWYRAMRESQPVSFDPQREAWLAFRYQDVMHVLSEYYLKDDDTVPTALAHLKQYLTFYNEQRLHQALDYRTPAAVFAQGSQSSLD